MTTPRIIAAGIVLVLAGIAVIALGGSLVVSAIGVALVGCGCVVFVSLLFFLVGESEDRDAARRRGR
jgi:hypothetical protein